MGLTDEELNLYDSLTNDAERKNFKKMHPHRLKYELIIETILNFLLRVLNSLKGKQTDEITHYAELELQMLTTKLLAFSVLIQKWGAYNTEKDIKLNPIVDPVVLGGLARNIYEDLVINHARRVSNVKNASREELSLLTEDDFISTIIER